MPDLLNDFRKASEKEKHLKCYSSLIRRARPYTLDNDAVEMITEIASGPTIADKLAIYRILARLPFDVIWLELDYDARYNTRVKLGTSVGAKPKDTPDRMGWLMERITETVWRATTIIRYDAAATGSGRTVDTFGSVHVLSTEGPLEFRSFARDPVLREAVQEMNKADAHYPDGTGASMGQALAWGFGQRANDSEGGTKYITLPQHLAGTNAVDVAPSWEPILETVSGGVASVKRERAKKHMFDSSVELQGDLRFLCAALATINEVPITYRDVQEPGHQLIKGSIKPYLINRIVTIALPKRKGRVNKIMGMLRLAEKRMRAHEVGGHFKIVRSGPNRSIVERRWIKDYQRGDASLGFVRQEREVVTQ
jgi:hypothetical protein